MLELIRRTNERLDRQAERDAQINARADAPMVDEPVWWLHKR
jgi:hypothetical protein